MYPRYNSKQLKKTKSINLVLTLMFLGFYSYTLPLTSNVILGIGIWLVVVTRIVFCPDKKNKLHEVMIMGCGLFLYYDTLDLHLSWSLSTAIPYFILIMTLILTGMIIFNKKGWDRYYQNHLFGGVIMFLLLLLACFGLIQFNYVIVYGCVISVMSMWLIHRYYGQVVIDKVKVYLHR